MLPVIMVTSSIGQEKTKAIEAGADDFIPKPFNHDELLTRVRSLLRIKRYHDTIKAQAAELRANRTLEQRVQTRSSELERLRRLQRFLSPQLADAIVSSGDESVLRSHRRQVTVLFCRPARLHELRRRGRARGADARARRVPRRDRPAGRALRRDRRLPRRATASSSSSTTRSRSRTRRCSAVRLGVRAARGDGRALLSGGASVATSSTSASGIALGYATCGEIGFEGRSDYAAIGAVTNLASRLADEATGGQILIAQRLLAEVEDDVEVEPAGEFTLKGFARPVPAFNVVAVRSAAPEPSRR